MTDRNFERELHHYVYRDMENGDDVEEIDYRSLAYILEEFCDRIEQLERKLEQQEEYAMEQNERYG
jgi:hypothetical protein